MAPARVLIANRGEIALRVIKACSKLGLTSIAVFTEADRGTLPTHEASEAVYLGERPGLYTDIPTLIQAAKNAKADAIHPGYGFLSENEDFVDAVEAAGIEWLGPRKSTIQEQSLKHVAKEGALRADVPVLAGSPLVSTAEAAVAEAVRVGYPVLLKATGGGGGMGIYKCFSDEQVLSSFPLAVSQGQKSFGNGDVFVEKYIQNAKHIEVQVFGDGDGHVVALGERECSVQRRHQKVVEECPSPFVDPPLREALMAAAVRLCSAAKYRSAGTVEFLVDADERSFYFLEVNTRLQVEHGITELVCGVDIVEWMLRVQLPIEGSDTVGASTPEQFKTELSGFKLNMQGSAMECRLTSEDPCHGLIPSSGLLGEVAWAADVPGMRIDTWVASGTVVSHNYDSLLAKVMVHTPTRDATIAGMLAVLRGSRVKGIPNNVQLLEAVLENAVFCSGAYTTHVLEGIKLQPRYIEVLDGGVQTTVQDSPGRTRLWHVGVPPSGPMDELSLRYANALVGNEPCSAGLEVTLKGPSLRLHCNAIIAVCGGTFPVEVDGAAVPMWQGVAVKAGGVVSIGAAAAGSRCYLAVSGGFDAPLYLGSRATFPSGNLGGYQGRALQTGDSCELGLPPAAVQPGAAVPAEWRPHLGEPVDGSGTNAWTVRMTPGPQSAPDYFTQEDIDTLSSATYEVHYNSNRLGIRLTGPRPKFARTSGGEGGAHPSNVHDHVYAIGAINFTGDMPVILTVDGPSLGGFVCPATTIAADMWKWGQVKPGDAVRFKMVTVEEALRQRLLNDARVGAVHGAAMGAAVDIAKIDASAVPDCAGWPATQAVLHRTADSILRLAGDRYVFLEFGDMVLDFGVRAKVAELEKWLADNAPPGLVETSPGVRSCLIEYDARVLPLPALMELIATAERSLPDVSKLKIQSRVLKLPMAFHDRWSREATDKYRQSVRPEAAYLPDNVPFAAEINALRGVDDVRDIMFSASYMVFGLGDVYLGAPCAVPVNPLHRLVCPKYNPARTFTWEGTVGIGGTYLCIYPMSSPGGYQLMGRTLPIWNTHGMQKPFNPAKPWLLEIFDQIRFFQVSETELEAARRDFTSGDYPLDITTEEFDFGAYVGFCESIAEETAAWKARQAEAVDKMLQKDAEILARLEASGYVAGGGTGVQADEEEHAFDGPEFAKVVAPFAANVWEVACEVGATVAAGEQLVVLEAMKMETPVTAPSAGKVVAVFAKKGQLINRSTAMVIIDVSAAA